MNLNAKSIERLGEVHDDLARVVYRAAEITEVPFVVTEGKRAKEKQQQLKDMGASQTLRSRHVPESNECGVACAVDLAAWLDDGDGVPENGEIRWDWPLYPKIAAAMKEAAEIEGVPIEWGGDWKTLKDGPHFQLPWKAYP